MPAPVCACRRWPQQPWGTATLPQIQQLFAANLPPFPATIVNFMNQFWLNGLCIKLTSGMDEMENSKKRRIRFDSVSL